MNDRDLIVALRAELIRELPLAGFAGVAVAQADQETGQGRLSGPVLYISRLSNPKLGWQSRQYRMIGGAVVRREAQWMRTSFQITALHDGGNAIDLANTAEMILQSRAVVDSLIAKGVGIERISEIRTPSIKNDQGRFEETPNFDVFLTHQRKITQASATVTGVAVETFPIT